MSEYISDRVKYDKINIMRLRARGLPTKMQAEWQQTIKQKDKEISMLTECIATLGTKINNYETIINHLTITK